jgi:hypothetical protein
MKHKIEEHENNEKQLQIIFEESIKINTFPYFKIENKILKYFTKSLIGFTMGSKGAYSNRSAVAM